MLLNLIRSCHIYFGSSGPVSVVIFDTAEVRVETVPGPLGIWTALSLSKAEMGFAGTLGQRKTTSFTFLQIKAQGDALGYIVLISPSQVFLEGMKTLTLGHKVIGEYRYWEDLLKLGSDFKCVATEVFLYGKRMTITDN